MEGDVLKHFVNRDVEVLVGGVWIEGHLSPIVKGVVTLVPVGEAQQFYGPCAFKQDAIQAIRQVKRQAQPVPNVETQPTDNQVRSSLEQVTPGMRFVRK